MLSKLLPGWTVKPAEDNEILVVAPNGNGTHIADKGSLANRILYQLASALIDTTTSKQADKGLHEVAFNFARREGGEITTLGMLKLSTSLPTEQVAWVGFIDTINHWVATTEAGRKAWEESSKDLNIGDLANYNAFKDVDFQRLLAERGLTFKSLDTADTQQAFSYDQVLVDEDELEEIRPARQRG